MRIVLTGGCTGGHIYPALAIGDKFKEHDPECEIIYIAHAWGLETTVVPAHGYDLKIVPAMWVDRSNFLKLAKTAFINVKGRSEAYKIIKDFEPDIVVSTGSFVSVPVVSAAKKYGAKIYIHEQNAFPGLANKAFAGDAQKVFLGFEGAREFFKRKDNLVYTGNPIRKCFSETDRTESRRTFEIPEDNFVITIFGGSLGASTINEVGIELIREYAGRNDVTILFGTGREYYDSIKARLDEMSLADCENIKVMPYIFDMASALSAANIVVCRSGALTVAEITASGRAAIFIPSPNVTGNHQYYNAKAIVDNNGAVIVNEDENTSENVSVIVRELILDPVQVEVFEKGSSASASCDAAEVIYGEIMRSYKE